VRQQNHLVVFVKDPRIGCVKSRLAADIGRVPAWAFYRHTLANILSTLEKPRQWNCWLAVTPDIAIKATYLAPKTWRRKGQKGGDLGQRMGRFMKESPPGPVVIIGTDIPEISPRHITKAFKALESNDGVFGPANDGGYWLVGLRRRPKVIDLFQNVRWGTSHALADTRANLTTKKKVALLEILEDIDDGKSYSRWKNRQQS
jgi:rSAM/selenodomain-associated transferase 1